MKSTYQEYIQTERFYLMKLMVKHVGSTYVSWLNDPETNRYLESRSLNHTLESTIQYVKECCEDSLIFQFAIFDSANDHHIGNIKLSLFHDEQKKGEIGILIGEKRYWGKGVATEVIRVLVKFGFQSLNLEQIVAGCYVSNIGSLKAFEKAGFSVIKKLKSSHLLDGIPEDSYCLSIFVDDYNS